MKWLYVGTVPGQILNGTVPGQILNGTLPGQILNGTLPGQILNGTVSGQILNKESLRTFVVYQKKKLAKNGFCVDQINRLLAYSGISVSLTSSSY